MPTQQARPPAHPLLQEIIQPEDIQLLRFLGSGGWAGGRAYAHGWQGCWPRGRAQGRRAVDGMREGRAPGKASRQAGLWMHLNRLPRFPSSRSELLAGPMQPTRVVDVPHPQTQTLLLTWSFPAPCRFGDVYLGKWHGCEVAVK